MKLRVYLGLCLALALAVGASVLLNRIEIRGGEREEKVIYPAEETLALPVQPGERVEPEEPDASELPETAESGDFVGLWVPYFSLAAGGESPEEREQNFRENFKEIAQAASSKNITALFVHVRPFCDALYPSETYPWSHILTGEQGGDPGFDPLAFMVQYSHSLGMELHAWINPLRIKTAESEWELNPDSPYRTLRDDYPYYFMEWGGGLYLDPAWPYVRTMIANGAAEIAENYPVDGIHFDDYFYPSQDASLDWQAYELYTQNTETPLPLDDWRRANISALLQEVCAAVHRAREGCVFGVSPQGNLNNDWNMGADVAQWCAAAGYVDYVCPQLYYSFENPALGYGEALDSWLALPRDESVALYVGLALYKVDSDADEGTWQLSDDIIARQKEAAEAAQCSGVVLYSSDYLEKYE